MSPVWGVWLDRRLWFSCDLSSRKAKNLADNPTCSISTQDPLEPVVLDGVAAPVLERAEIERYVEAERVKYSTEWQLDAYTVDFFDGNLGGGCTFQLTPSTVFGLSEKEFDTSPTRWNL